MLKNILFFFISFYFFSFNVFCAQLEEKTTAKEYQIKAVYLYNFLVFTTWPKGLENSSEIVIGILGDNPFNDYFNDVKDNVIEPFGKILKIKEFGDYSEEIDLTGCHLLFISHSEEKNYNRIFGKIKKFPVITVGDGGDFLEKGGMIYLKKVGTRIRWLINKISVDHSGLKLNSQIFQSAVSVVEFS